MNIFMQAALLKLQFSTTVGSLSVEDLFDLPLKSTTGPSLFGIGNSLHQAIKSSDDDEFFSTKPNTENKEIQLRFEIVKEVIEYRQEENARKLDSKKKKELKEKLLAVKARKQEASFDNMDESEIDKMLEDL